MSVQTSSVTPVQACVELADVFQNPLLEDPHQAKTSRQRHHQSMLVNRAEQACLNCPMLQECLYAAVVEHDVAGYVAGTTPRQRVQIRAVLGHTVAPEDLESFVGITGAKRQIDPSEVLRQRTQNPHESLESIAQRMGCSLSTVKRHLRKARSQQPRERCTQPRPSRGEVLRTAASVLGRADITRVA